MEICLVIENRTYRTGIVVQLEVGFFVSLFGRFGLGEVRALSQMVVIQFSQERLISGLGYNTFLFQDR